MRDRELLELAAKASGLNVEFDGSRFTVDVPWRHGLSNVETWNPLEDDGDALRLAVRLRLAVSVCDKYTWVESDGGCGVSEYASMVSTPEEVTRRAIVRAAAEIGKGMP